MVSGSKVEGSWGADLEIEKSVSKGTVQAPFESLAIGFSWGSSW